MRTTLLRRAGFTLIEIMCVLFLLAVIGLVMAVMFKETMGMERSQAASLVQMQQIHLLIDQFRLDVAEAAASPLEWQEFKTNPQTLILHMSRNHHVVYQWQQGELQRIQFLGQARTERRLPAGTRTVRGVFERIESKSPLIRLRLHPLRPGNSETRPSMIVDAALGGDRR